MEDRHKRSKRQSTVEGPETELDADTELVEHKCRVCNAKVYLEPGVKFKVCPECGAPQSGKRVRAWLDPRVAQPL